MEAMEQQLADRRAEVQRIREDNPSPRSDSGAGRQLTTLEKTISASATNPSTSSRLETSTR